MVCQTTGSVRLYTDLSKTTLVDAFSFANAPTTHRIGSGDFVIQGDVSGPGVDVVVVVAGTPHVLGFRLVSKHCFEPWRHRDPTLVDDGLPNGEGHLLLSGNLGEGTDLAPQAGD